jgi:hypothetical protein
MNKYDNARGARVTDALLNFETVKCFGNEALERNCLERAILDYQAVEYKLMASLNGLNVLQSVIIFTGLIAGLVVCTKVRLTSISPCRVAISPSLAAMLCAAWPPWLSSCTNARWLLDAGCSSHCRDCQCPLPAAFMWDLFPDGASRGASRSACWRYA